MGRVSLVCLLRKMARSCERGTAGLFFEAPFAFEIPWWVRNSGNGTMHVRGCKEVEDEEVLNGAKRSGRYSHYSMILSPYHYYFNERRKLSFLPFSCLYQGCFPTLDGREVGREQRGIILVSLFRSLGAIILLMVNLGFHEQK